MKKPPKKLSRLMRLALNDLYKVERSPKYRVNMYLWHEGIDKSYCSVCFAGSIMAKTLGSKTDAVKGPRDFGYDWSRAFFALDHVRNGKVQDAMASLVQPTYKVPSREVCSYYEDPKQWRKDMWKIVRELERKRL